MYTLYKPSGKLSLLAIPYYLAAGLFLFPLVGFLYAYAIWYCPFVYVNFIITVAFGATIGGTLGYIVEKAKVRNKIIAVFFTAIFSAFAYYVHWVVWVDLAMNAGQILGDERLASIAVSNVSFNQLITLFSNPLATLDIIKEINVVGIWGLAGSSDTANGGLLTFFWILEAAIIFWLAITFGTKKVKNPFSEKLNVWLPSKSFARLEFTKEPKKLLQTLLKGDLSLLHAMNKSNGLENHTEFTLFFSDADEFYLTFTNRTAKFDKEKIDFTDNDFITALRIDNSLLELISAKPLPNEEEQQQATEDSATETEKNTGLYDSNNTITIATLLKTPISNRDETWADDFNRSILTASFSSGTPQVVQGPDGFPYFKLQLPESKKAFNPFSLVSIKDHVLKNGYGVALSLDGVQIVWSIPHGAMVNLHLTGELFISATRENLDEIETLTEETTVVTGQPAEDYLPSQTREVLKDFLKSQGFDNPKIILMMRDTQEGSRSELVFNIYPENFETEEHFENMMRKIQWFLPEHYAVISLEKEVGENQEMYPL